MEHLTNQKLEVLLHIYQAQREESLSHRQSIFNYFSLSTAGLTALMAGVVAAGHIETPIKVIAGVVAITVSLFIANSVNRQRKESEKALSIVRSIEEELGLYEKGRYLSGMSILPADPKDGYIQPLKNWRGFTKIDLVHVGTLILISLSIIIALAVS